MKHIPRDELKVGMVVVCGDEGHKPSSCWSSDLGSVRGVGVPAKITGITGRYVDHKTLDGKFVAGCDCSDLDHLYLYEEEPMTLENLEVGTILLCTGGDYRRVLAVLGGEGELRTYIMSGWADGLTDDQLKVAGTAYTAFDLSKSHYSIYSPDEVTEINGKKYRTKDVTERLAELEEVE